MPWGNASQLLLYHGTIALHMRSITNGIDVMISGFSKDFSRGFYTTTYFEQARTRARNLRYRMRAIVAANDAVAVIAVFRVRREALGSLSSMTFIYPTGDFWDLIDWCRAGNPSHHAGSYFDMVYGLVSEDYENRLIHPGYDQVSFHNQTTVGVLGTPQWRRG